MERICYVISHTVEEGALLLECEVRPLQDKTTNNSGLHLRGSITPHGQYRTTRRSGRRSHARSRVHRHTRRAHLLDGRVQIGTAPCVEALAAEADRTRAVLQA